MQGFCFLSWLSPWGCRWFYPSLNSVPMLDCTKSVHRRPTYMHEAFFLWGGGWWAANIHRINTLFFKHQFSLLNSKKSQSSHLSLENLCNVPAPLFPNEIGRPYSDLILFLRGVVSFCSENKALTHSICFLRLLWMNAGSIIYHKMHSGAFSLQALWLMEVTFVISLS
jgi:hypothetical protein